MSAQSSRKSQRRWVALALGAMLWTTSCGRKRPEELPVVPVHGQVFVDKAPAHNAMVWLHPMNETGPDAPRPFGKVDMNGNFEIGTYKPNDGAPPGKYRVSVIWRIPPKSGDEDGEDLVAPRYMDPEKSGLPVVNVLSNPTTLPPFYLSKS